MSNKFRPMKARLRATFGGGDLVSRLESVDAEADVLHGVQITLEGEAKGHGVFLDREFCEAVAAAGNATGDVGLKVRYGHPAMCSDALGTELGRARNFRVIDIERDIDGEKVQAAGVVADVHILAAAHAAPQGDIAAHVLAVAAEDPKQFGQSIVFTYGDWVVKDKDGVRHSYREEVMGVDAEGKVIVGEDGKAKDRISEEAWRAKSADGREYAVLGKLLGTDFTDTPAATDGIFSAGSLAEEATELLDAHPQIRELMLNSPKNVVEFLKRSDLFDALAAEIESVRCANLQSAKDRRIAELKEIENGLNETIFECRNKIENLEAALAEKTAALETLTAEMNQLKSDAAEVAGALAARGCESVKQFCDIFDETSGALSKTKAALDAETKRYREQVGSAMTQPEYLPTLQEGLAKCATPAEKSAFIASGKFRKN